jgi:hypothetical protein
MFDIKILSILTIFLVLFIASNIFGSNGPTYEQVHNKNNQTRINKKKLQRYSQLGENIYYLTEVDASIVIFKKNNIDYKNTVYREFFPIVKDFMKYISKQDFFKIIDIYLSQKKLNRIMMDYKSLNYSFNTKEEFIRMWTSLIKNDKEKFLYRSPLLFIFDKSIQWEKYDWFIVPQSYVQKDGKFIYRFILSIYTYRKSPESYHFRFIKENDKYKLQEVDILFEGQSTGPFFEG